MAQPRIWQSALVLLTVVWVGSATAQTPTLPTSSLLPLPNNSTEQEPEPRPKSKTPEKTKAAKAAPKPAPLGDPALDPKAARIDADERLKPTPSTSESTAVIPIPKALRETLVDRLKWLDDYDKAVKERRLAENPNPNPESQSNERKAELEHAKAALESSSKDPKKLLPELFQGTENVVPEAKLTEMREAIESLRTEVQDRSTELEKLRANIGRSGQTAIANHRAERDKISQRTATLPARRAERETAVLSATTPEARDLARERLATFDWEARAEAEKLKAVEALITLETKKSDLVNLTAQARDFGLRVAKLTLEQMQGRYRTLADTQQNALRAAAAGEASRATNSVDLVERFRANRRAELLELQARLINDKKSYAASPRISLLEQTEAAERAYAEFESLKTLVKDEKVSSLDALQLNNDFRRVSRERNLISRNELTEASGILAYYENILTETELELLSDARDDRFELESLLSMLPESRHAEARAMIEGINAEHRALLVERRAVLRKLSTRAKETHAQVVRRLKVLDDEYAFVRANLFWIRDAEPIGLNTLYQARRELRHLIPGLIRLAGEPFDRMLWTRPSVEFGLALSAAILLPFVLLYLRRAVRFLV